VSFYSFWWLVILLSLRLKPPILSTSASQQTELIYSGRNIPIISQEVKISSPKNLKN
jgi:hypothetical protein